MAPRSFHDGRDDGLTPLHSLDLNQVDSFVTLVQAMSRTAFGGRQLGEAFEILRLLALESDCRVVLTLSGAMTVAKQGRIICELIERGLVHAIVATGALIAHGLTESTGRTHYRSEPSTSDETLYAQGYNRIYDTLEMESNLEHVERLIRSVLNDTSPPGGVWSSSEFCRAVGRRLSELDEGPGILRSAFECEAPVFIPAFTDSEIGLDVATWSMKQQFDTRDGDPLAATADDVFQNPPAFNPFLDLLAYARLMSGAGQLGIVTIGGGVPRNWAQQLGPLHEISNARLGCELAAPRFQYGVRICPEPVHWGGLSGCTYSEGVSWGKFAPREEGGRFAEVYADATLVLPLLAKALFESLDG